MGLTPFQPDKATQVPADIDLRKEVDLIFHRHGHWGLLRKRVRDRKCQCYNEQTHEARAECRSCLGSGWAFIDYPVRYRKTSLVQMTEAPTQLGRSSGGPLVKIYLRCSAKPDRGDFFAEIAQDEESLLRNFRIQPNLPLTITKMYDLQDVLDMREAGGRVEFFTVLAELADLGDTT